MNVLLFTAYGILQLMVTCSGEH